MILGEWYTAATCWMIWKARRRHRGSFSPSIAVRETSMRSRSGGEEERGAGGGSKAIVPYWDTNASQSVSAACLPGLAKGGTWTVVANLRRRPTPASLVAAGLLINERQAMAACSTHGQSDRRAPKKSAMTSALPPIRTSGAPITTSDSNLHPIALFSWSALVNQGCRERVSCKRSRSPCCNSLQIYMR